MRRLLAAVLVATAAADGYRESLRQRERRRKALINQVSDRDRDGITEMHAQGLHPHHISTELGLRSGDWVAEVIEALDLKPKKPGQGARRHVPPAGARKKARARPHPRDAPDAHRERRRRESAARRGEL